MSKPFRTCPICGSNLDPCERCECLDEEPQTRTNQIGHVPKKEGETK